MSTFGTQFECVRILTNKTNKHMAEMTIRTLVSFCLEQMKNGNGDKKILISNDDEGNGYHGLYYAFTEANEMGLSEFEIPYGVKVSELSDYVILG